MMAPEQDATICWIGVMPLLAEEAELWPFMLLSWKARLKSSTLQVNACDTCV